MGKGGSEVHNKYIRIRPHLNATQSLNLKVIGKELLEVDYFVQTSIYIFINVVMYPRSEKFERGGEIHIVKEWIKSFLMVHDMMCVRKKNKNQP